MVENVQCEPNGLTVWADNIKAPDRLPEVRLVHRGHYTMCGKRRYTATDSPTGQTNGGPGSLTVRSCADWYAEESILYGHGWRLVFRHLLAVHAGNSFGLAAPGIDHR
jgi:hypothetical protein